MAFWNRKENRNTGTGNKGNIETRDSYTLSDILLQAGIGTDTVTVAQAMTIPAYSASVHLISNTIASLPIKLYKKEGDKVEVQDNDPRVALLNQNTGDTLDGFQLKKALIVDFLNYGGGYAYLNRVRNQVKSIHYVPNYMVGVVSSPDPIFKRNDFTVYGSYYRDYEFIKLLRNTWNGATGYGLVTENNQMLSVAYNTLLFELMLVKTGGNKKGFIKAQRRLGAEAIAQLKQAWNNLYANNTSDNVVILNEGLDFQEANNSSVEMQLNQNKLSHNMEIYQMFGIPYEVMNGKATGGNAMIHDSFIKMAILPNLESLTTAINAVMLLESEKGSFYFEVDTKELLKGNVLQRYQAYDLAIKNGILQIDEVRQVENYEPMNLDFIKLGLADVLYYPKTGEIFTPNTNSLVKKGEGGIEQENSPNQDQSNMDPNNANLAPNQAQANSNQAKPGPANTKQANGNVKKSQSNPANGGPKSPKADTSKKGVKNNASGNS